jgi:glutathione S-transferase
MTTQQTPVLYTFRRCPYAMRARMALAYADINFEIREVELRNKPPTLMALSPKATVPVLLIADRVVDESLDIMDWALEQRDQDGWLDCSEATVARMRSQVEACEREFKPNLDRYKYADRHPELSQLQHRQEAETFLKLLDDQLAHQVLSGNHYLFGSTPGYADVAIFPFVRQFAHVDIEWFRTSPYLALQLWLDHFLNSRLFQAIMKKSPAWQEGDSPTYFRIQ